MEAILRNVAWSMQPECAGGKQIEDPRESMGRTLTALLRSNRYYHKGRGQSSQRKWLAESDAFRLELEQSICALSGGWHQRTA
jgi:hypothetical protein